jgi:phage terminase large subunit
VRANWRDNPWFPGVLEEERQHDLQLYPERYPHIWEGEYARAYEGAYFARHLEEARQQGRIGHVAVDPILSVKAFFDIGGAGHSSDAMAIWIAQFVGREIRLLDYVEGVGQPLSYYAHELRRRGWKDAIIYLPHDGVATNNITGKRYIDHWTEAGFECGTPIKNTGAGASMMRVEAARRVFPRCWFNESPTEAGREALGYYHERQDEKRSIGLGPEHDWSSHAADAFGYMAIAYEEPPVKIRAGLIRVWLNCRAERIGASEQAYFSNVVRWVPVSSLGAVSLRCRIFWSLRVLRPASVDVCFCPDRVTFCMAADGAMCQRTKSLRDSLRWAAYLNTS